MGLDKDCEVIREGRLSGGTSGLTIGNVSQEEAVKGNIALVENGDWIVIDIPNRTIDIDVSTDIIEKRKIEMEGRDKMAYKPKNRVRNISNSLKIYSHFVSSADCGAVRIVNE